MPKGFTLGDVSPVLEAEAAAAFDELTLTGRDALLTEQRAYDWPNEFRVARFYSAVDYIQAQRARTLAMAAMAKMFAGVDVIVTPSSGAQLTATNLTGHPAVIVPNGVRGEDAPPPEQSGDGDPANWRAGDAGVAYVSGRTLPGCEAAGVCAGVPGGDGVCQKLRPKLESREAVWAKRSLRAKRRGLVKEYARRGCGRGGGRCVVRD